LKDLVFSTLIEENINRMFCSLKYSLFLATISRKSEDIFNVLLIVAVGGFLVRIMPALF